MDQNKAQKLTDIGYEIKPSCVLCIYSLFQQNDWGLCRLHTYDHKKHDGTHQLSIHKSGGCPRFEPSEAQVASMYHYIDFFKI